MTKYVWLVFTNCVPGRADEFNRWYDDIHLPDLLRIPGVVSAERSELIGPQMARVGDQLIMSDAAGIGAKFKYLACYHIDTNDIESLLREVKRRADTAAMELSPALGDSYTIMFKDRC